MTTPDNQGQKLLPFYLVIDVSYSMDGKPLDEANRILPEVIDAIAQQPILSDKVRIGLVDFADDARVQLPLCDVLDPGLTLPTLAVRGGTSYAAAFQLLRSEITANVKQLKADGFLVHRPAVFFLSDGDPLDEPNEWENAFQELISDKAYPNVIPFGVGGASGKILQQLIHPSTGNKQMKMYLTANGEEAAAAIRKSAEILISSIIQSGHSISQNQSGIVLPPDDDLPKGISSYTADDDDFV
jgi:uncharacterized protein YegL